MNRQQQFHIWYWIGAFLLLLLFQGWWQAASTTERIPYSRFLELLEKDRVAAVQIEPDRIVGRYREPVDGKRVFVTTIVPEPLAQRLEKSSAEFDGTIRNTFLSTVLSWVLPVILFFALWAFFFRGFAERQGLGGLMSVGKSKARIYVEKDTGVTFDDVAGIEEAKAELKEIVAFLKEPERYGRLGARIPKGILLVGPPGTGKTLVARAIAGEAGVPFFSISGSEFVEMFVGVGAARVRDLFEQARKAAPCIIFIDELDALGKRRGIGIAGGGHDEKEQTLNQLLTELDGFDPRDGIVLLGATNRPEILDPALLRAGRFDRQVVIDRPDRRGRAAILQVHLRKVKHAGLDVDAIAGLTPGFSGAELANLVNEAAIRATRRGAEAVTMDDVTAALERIVAGLERPGRLLNPRERETVAYHEMGHALAAASLPGADPVHKVSIIPRSIGALGYTMQRPTEDRFLITRADLEDRMVVLLAGRAAEELVFGEISTGAADDLARVTDIARQIVTRFGMHPALGQAVLEPERQSFLGEGPPGLVPRDYAEATAREVDLAVRELIDKAYARAKDLLMSRRADLEAGARLLLERETITPEDFPPLRSTRRLPEPVV
ncbi:MAG: ATP-dependent zinc metalloprotease FtsH [Sphingomonadaceae bacterium]|uniref:ATP-dependent zinc metalloprotease FtsH n=1 Tax=Thermaurantiacus sp. TaxID=2820283 RepID=UPI00298F13E2|nr:ATP-dependent zinc metalloprotease FtsH [Thermaurantiacus sp.]MCS6986290.1 ATP-dependent zinc metalloprotease FtsH [Sphingomonadaceae bacterium]MDW8415739.1 ATP-dependent zinc metalloprotease FtsH [Thermaurantiacus sp.]